MFEPVDYDCENGTCPNCGDVCMDVIENPDGREHIIRFICPCCDYYEDFDDSPIEGESEIILPPYDE